MEVINLRNYDEFEILRGFAIIGVLIIHTFSELQQINEFNAINITLIPLWTLSQTAVPLFIFISGFMLYKNYNDNYDIFNYYKKRFKRIIPVYLLFSIFYEFYFYLFIELKFNITLANLYKIIADLLTASAFYHFWFIGLIVNFYIFYPLINKVVNKYKRKLNYLLLLSIIIQILWISIRVYFLKMINKNLNIFTTIIWYSIKYFFLSDIAFFMLGIYICFKYNQNFKVLTSKSFSYILIAFFILFTIILSLLWLNKIHGPYKSIIQNVALFLYAPMILLLYKIALRIKNEKRLLKKIFLFLGKLSFIIYLIQGGIIILIISFIKKIGLTYNSWYYYLLVFLISAIVSIVPSYLISLLPYNEFFILRRKSFEIKS